MEDHATATSSPPTITPNHDNNGKICTNSSNIREEGELSASENDEFAGSQFPDSTTLIREPSEVAPLNKDANVVEMRKSALARNPTYAAVASRTSLHSNHRKGPEKNRVPFVISFSDDDSGSDSEEDRQANTIESDDMTRGVVESRNLSNSQMVQKSNTKIPKKLSMNRTFVSSMNRVNGTSSKNGGGTFLGPKSHHKKSSAPKIGQNVHVNSNKLQDLRQLIAIRENELKSRAARHDKEATSSSLKNSTNMNFKRDLLVEPKEPEKKRLKVSEPHTNTLNSVGQYDKRPTESILAAESHGRKGTYDGSYGDKEILIGTGQSKKIDDHDISSMNLPLGTGMIRNNRRHNRITNLVESSAPLATKTATASPKRQGCVNNSSFWNSFGTTNMSGSGDMDIKSLLEIEELQDKELDEAQEHRRKCEIEERNALKAYRKAQRALAEANTRCSYLYHKRELFSAKIRSHVMEDSSLFWSNVPHNVNPITNMSQNNMHLVPISNHQLQNEFDLNIRSADGKNLVSGSCDEPDTTASEPQEEEKTNGMCSSLHENNNTLAEDEQTSAFELKAGGSSLDSHGEGTCSGRTKEINDESISLDPTQDSLLLEAALRSQLFARLGNKSSQKKNESSQSVEPTVEREDRGIMEGTGNVPSSDAEKDQVLDFQDTERSEKSTSEHPIDIKDQCEVEKFSVNYESSFLAEPILRSAFRHIKFTDVTPSHTQNPLIHSNSKKNIEGVCGARPTDIISNLEKCSEVDSHSNNLAINPFWPLCVFELRGKCNDDECPWQHVRDYSSKDNVVGSPLQSRNRATNIPLAPPTYLVCLDILKADSHPYKHLLAETVGQRWHKYFSASLVVSSSFLADLHSDEPCLHGPETRIEVHGGWNRQSSYFHGKTAKEGTADQDVDDSEQALEIALINLSREVNKQKGRREALIVLARALEQHPTSVPLWIVYLHIYYSNQKSIGKDDLFRYAVDHNESSYELWLMFINSRDNLNDRLLAYNTALCRHTSDPDLSSDCILDLFLQMINFLCYSGEINKAIEKIRELFPSTKRPTNPHTSFLPDIHTHLTIRDKCVFWVCCVYFLTYKKLPETILWQFECRKELPEIEWHSAHLTDEEKRESVALMELASESLASCIENEKTVLFAINHIRCTAVIEGFDRSKILMKKYFQLYPSCLELVLLSARAEEFESTDGTHKAFDAALRNWVGKPGIEYIQNQYSEFALQKGRVDFVKELMGQWFSGSPIDVFGFLNLALYKQLHNEHTEARFAVEKALELSSSKDYTHCVKEHAVFFLKHGPLNAFLHAFNHYLTDPRAPTPPEPLSRSFIKTIKKQNIQKLVNNLLSPVSSDFSLLNSVLESCFGPSLLPFQDFKSTEITDFIESVMQTTPANFRLAVSLCKTFSGDANAGISFWASSLLMNALFQAVPVAPESVWVEAAGVVFVSLSESFHKRALSVYPCSIQLWKSYRGLSKNPDEVNTIVEMARQKGIKLD